MKPCPFCGDDQSLQVDELDEQGRFSPTEYAVICGNCGAGGPTVRRPKLAEPAWNERTEPDDVEG